MNKTTLAKWTLAALMAIPAVPMFGKPVHHKLLVHRTRHALMSVSARRRLLAHRKGHITLSLRKKGFLHRGGISAHHLTHKKGLHSASMNSTGHFKVHITKMPPTIDGINA